MSQVRKLQTGGTTNKTYGHLVIDGIDLGNSEDTYRQFSEHAKLQDPRQGEAYAKWLQDLREGRDVILDVDNTANSHPDSMSDERAGKRTWVRKVADDMFNTNRNIFSEAIYTARQFNPIKTPVKKKKHTNDSVGFIFNGENNKYDTTAMGNLGMNDRFNSYLDWLSNDNWENENEFTTNLSDQQKSNLRAWYNSLPGATPEEKRQQALNIWNANLDRVKAAEGGYDAIDASTKDFFSNFNIGGSGTSSSSNGSSTSASEAEKQARAKLKNAGYNEDLYKLIGDNFELGDDGILRSKSGIFDLGLGDGNIYFNDDFYNSVYGADGRYNSLKGLTYYNGALYKSDNPTLAQILNASGGYNQLVTNGDFIGADRIIRTRFTPEEMENPGTLAADSYSSYVKPGMQFSNLTGLYTLADGSMKDGEQLIQYIDLNSPVQDGPYQRYNYKFALLDNHGNLIRDDIDKSNLSKIVGGSSAGDLLTYKKTTNRGTGRYANKYYEDIVGSNGEASGIRIYRDINNPDSDVILHVEGLRGSAKGKDIALPKEVAEILMNDQGWIDKVIGNSQARNNFEKILSNLTRPGLFNMWNPNSNFYSNLLDITPYLRLGLSRPNALKLRSAIIKAARNGSKHERRERYLLEAPEFRLGGKIDYIYKLAGGGFAGGSKSSTGVTERRVDKAVHNSKNASSLAEIGSDNWTSADTTDLMALGADLASLGLAFVPGANTASMATGVASSLARYSADKERGTKGAGAQLALNLAMDAAVMLPFAGGGIKSLELVNKVKKALPTIIKAASIYGLGSAVITSAKKIANGEKFTVRDISNVVNGITAGVGIAKSGGFGKGVKKSGYEDINLTSKDGTKTITIEGKDVKGIDSPDKLFDALQAKSGLTKEQFAEQFDVSSLLTSKTKWTPGLKPKDWKNKSTEKIFEPTKLSGREPAQANGNAFHDWWYGVGGYQQAYRRSIIGEQPASATTVRKTVRTDGVIPVGSKRLSLSGAEQAAINSAPTMQQFDKFKQIARVHDASFTDAELESAFRGLLRETPSRFEIEFNKPLVETTFTGEKPTWYRGRTEGLSRVNNQEGIITTTRTRRYDTRQGLARPQIIMTHPRTDNEYQELPGTVYNPFFKKGGVIKAQNGWRFNYYRRDLPWNLMDDTAVDYNPFSITPPAELKGSTPEAYYAGAKDAITEAYGRAYDPNAVGYDLSYYNQPVNEQPVDEEPIKLQSSAAQTGVQSSAAGSSKYGDNNIDTSKALSSIYQNVLGAAEYFAKAKGRDKVYEDMKKGIREANYHDPYVHFDMYSTANPVADAQLTYLKQQNSTDNLPKTADYNAYVAGLLTKQDNINRALETATRSASAEYSAINKANTEIANKQKLSDQQITSGNLARDAGMRMQLAQNEASRDMQKYQSIANAIREQRMRTDTELQKANQFAFSNAANALDDKYEKSWNGKLGDYYNQWLALDSSVRDNYSDINDWLQRAPENKGVWSSYETAWNNHQNALNNERIRLYAKYNLSPGAEFIYRQRYGTYKRGGRVGRNRYKNEPEEDVWINENKAVQKQVGKLNDNIIKIFLKTLK